MRTNKTKKQENYKEKKKWKRKMTKKKWGSQLGQQQEVEGGEATQNSGEEEIVVEQTDQIEEYSKDDNLSTRSPAAMLVEKETPGTPVLSNRTNKVYRD